MQRNDIERLAKLSYIELSESDMPSILNDFKMLLSSAEPLKELKFDDSHKLDSSSVAKLDIAYPSNIAKLDITYLSLREDKALPSTSRSDILQNAPVKEDGYMIVPNVME